MKFVVKCKKIKHLTQIKDKQIYNVYVHLQLHRYAISNMLYLMKLKIQVYSLSGQVV